MKLLRETVEDVKFLTEERDGKKNLFIEGIFLMANTKNRNGRIYESHIMRNAVQKYMSENMQPARLTSWGELGHPESPTVGLKEACILITSLLEDGNNWIGKAKVLNTPNGRIVEALLESGGTLGVSSRGVGSLKPRDGIQYVGEDYHIATPADVVAHPSAHEAYVQGLSEGVEWVMNNGVWSIAEAEQERKTLQQTPKKNVEKYMLESFQRFVQKL